MYTGKFTVSTLRPMELIDITQQLAAVLAETGVSQGVCHLYNPHTTAGLTINEGADPTVIEDIIEGFREMVPINHSFKHLEGNSASHIMASIMGSSVTVFIENGRVSLGTWQKIFFCEFDGPRTRSVKWSIIPAA